ncbi:MAG: Gfo/Idh/MocA family oxidoreductase [Bryobacteraceae bacterium]
MKTRRRLFQEAAAVVPAVLGFPTIVKAAALGLGGAVPPSDRVTFATIGVGWMGGDHVGLFLRIPAVHYVAVCDVDDEHAAAAKAKIDSTYGNKDCASYRAFEEVLMRRDIDAVSIALPDHWHGLAAVSAARAGKDIYGEKPLAYSFAEGVAIREAVKKHGRIWQTGSWQRSVDNFRFGAELVRNGKIGRVSRVEVGLPDGHKDFAGTEGQTAFTKPPETLNYDRWLGPAPVAPYCPARVHKNWRWNLDYGGGQLMDWIGHHGDIAHWGLGFDHTGPYEIEGAGEYPPRTALWNTATKYRIVARYQGGVEMTIAGGYPEIRSGTKWIGDEGWVWVDRGGFETHPKSLMTLKESSEEEREEQAFRHYEEFIRCVKSRERTIAPADVALRSATPGWLGQIAMLTGRKLRWDPVKEEILGDADASKLLSRDMRSPWRL